ncbi:DUF6160 family protein [Acinetobacter sp. WZC-1]|uniref:DUF6160 family protein n=1 Tax=Acinetobacter sp. WZC-1 TaxID=3459034 RepID=UPI00403DDBB5
MTIKPIMMYGLVASMLSMPVMAMEALDDQRMAATVGQDGINLGLQLRKVELDQLAVIDTDGLTSQPGYAGRAAVVLAGPVKTPVKVELLGAASSAPDIQLVMDSDGGHGQPFANIALGYGNHVTGFKVSPFSLYLAGGNSVSSLNASKNIYGASGSLNTDVVKILTIGSAANNFTVDFHAVNKPGVQIQLGNIPQSHMMAFKGAIQSICGSGEGCPISFVSGQSGTGFDFQMKAYNPTDGFVLDGFYAGVTPGGLIITNPGTSSKMNMTMSNIMLGDSGAASATAFQGLNNSSMGTVGVTGAAVSNMKMTIKGM